MEQTTQRAVRPVNLLDALDGATNWRAFALYATTGFVWLLLELLAMRLQTRGSEQIALLVHLLGLGISFVGWSAAGIVLMDDSRWIQGRSLVDALLGAVFTLPRVVAILVAAVVAVGVYFLLLAAIYYVCKIPALGPFLFAIVFPAAAIATGIILFGLFFVVLSLVMPALWAGYGIAGTFALLWQIMRHRLLFVIVSLLRSLLLFLVALLLVAAVIGSGVLSAGSISVAVIGQGASPESVLGSIQSFIPGGRGGMSGGSGYTDAVIFAAMVLFIAWSIPPGLVLTKAMCLIFLAAMENLDVAAAEAAIAQRMAEVKQRAEAAAERARQAAPRSGPAPVAMGFAPSRAMPSPPRGAADPPDSPGAIPHAAAAATCPSCQAAITPADVFCGNCGHKLR